MQNVLRILLLSTSLIACGEGSDEVDDEEEEEGVTSRQACDRAVECYEELGGNPQDFDMRACVNASNGAEANADEADCGSEYDAYLTCAVDADCDDATACESEIMDYLDCIPQFTSSE